MITRSQILANRQTWIDFLMKPGRKKAKGFLDIGNGNRCCLGHACIALNIKKVKEAANFDEAKFSFGRQEDTQAAPKELIYLLGLHAEMGEWEVPADESFWDIEEDNSIFENYFAKISKLKLSKKKIDLLRECNSLADLNDETDFTPRQIGIYLQSVIEGGKDTPFKPLSDYPEE